MSLARVCDRCGRVIQNAENIRRVKVQTYDNEFTCMGLSHMACADICIGCCLELFNCFTSDDWNNILLYGVGEEEDKE